MVELFTKIIFDIIGLYRQDYSARFHIREMAKLIGTSHVRLIPHLNLLEGKNYLIQKKEGKNKSYRLNTGNTRLKELILISEKIALLSRLEDPILKKVYEEAYKTNNCIILFGSTASKTNMKDSDIDLLCIETLPKNEEESLKNLGRIYKRDIHLTTIALEDFRKKSALKEEIKKNHLLLNRAEIYLDESWRVVCEQS